MSDSLSNKELVAVGHQFAKAISCDTPIIDMVKIVSRLAERLDCTTAALREMTKQRDALGSENGQMLRLLTDISENYLEYLSEGEERMMAGVPLDYISEINMYVSRDVEAENPFKETDVLMANERAVTRNTLIAKPESRFNELSVSVPTLEQRSGAAGAAG
ncbi:hypothetical protein [Leclercia tamurae]|uniref:hypothetical protein n=1 Tax=Leclercia tamurae TaxID=2926467 RepID=UPI0036F47526